MSHDRSIARCPARAALAGNPSDMYGGAVVAVPVHSVGATVEVTSSTVFRIPGLPDAASLDELDELLRSSNSRSGRSLVAATLISLSHRFATDIDPVVVDVSSEIPRGVGLAGSSAIVVATLRALLAHRPDATWAAHLRADPWLLATVALDAEASILGIPAGMQDRVVQAVGENLVMDFADDREGAHGFRVLGALPGVAFVAHRSDRASDSGAVHSATDTTTEAFSTAMDALADRAHDAASAIDSGDVDALGTAMDATFDLRASCMDLDPAHVAMVDTARALGASATYTGSGGAVTVLCDDDARAGRAADALRSRLGCEIIALR